MTLRQKQTEFVKDVQKLLRYAFAQGYDVTFGEVYRSQPMQKWYVDHGLSWTMKSQHGKKLAIDLNLFKDGQYLSKSYQHKKLGKYWESLSPWNVWGGRFNDGNHYERRHDFPRRSLRGGKYKNDL